MELNENYETLLGYDRRNKKVFRRLWKIGKVGDDVTSCGRPFQVCAAATLKV